MATRPEAQVHPPETLEGWFALHTVSRLNRRVWRHLSREAREEALDEARGALHAIAAPSRGGWSAVATLVGSTGDLMAVHMRPTLDGIAEAERCLTRLQLWESMTPAFAFLSVAEVALYHASSELAADAKDRKGAIGDKIYKAKMAELVATELASPHTERRLRPPLPADMPYVSFYPMSKRRDGNENWYMLSIEERFKLMRGHGITGKRYAGRIVQIITGAIGLDRWEWGVTLFARDPLEFKHIVTDMRFDPASARYAEFGDFYVGKVCKPEEFIEAVR